MKLYYDKEQDRARGETQTLTQIAGPQSVDIVALNDPNLAPPGHYLLFVLDNNGVPCVEPVIQLVYT
jgi:hypothetical protein